MPRLAHVTVRNFQSIENASLDLGALTVIVGHSNSGKSAIVRALSAAFFNQTGGSFVREGAEEAQVHLVYEGEGTRILRWHKPRKGGAHYYLEGNEITRAGRELPLEVDALTGVREIECEGARARLQVDSQFDAPFLLAGTGGQAARLLARVSRLDALVTAQVRARRDAERARRDAEATEAWADDLDARLAALPDYEALLDRWTAISERVERAVEGAREVVRLRGVAGERTVLRARADRWAASGLPARVARLREAVAPVTEGLALWARREAAEAALSAAVDEAAQAKHNAEASRTELARLLAEMPFCPVCNRPMN